MRLQSVQNLSLILEHLSCRGSIVFMVILTISTGWKTWYVKLGGAVFNTDAI
jgi:hypothetical protein